MVSHESLAGHGHVQAAWLEAIGLVHEGGIRHWLGRKGLPLDIAIGIGMPIWHCW